MIIALVAALSTLVEPTAPAPPQVAAVRRTATVVIDGRLDDADWARAVPARDFRQRDPEEGRLATQRTEVRFLFDDDALYVGARMFDTRGKAGVETRLARRDDEPNADYFMLVFDTYHDHAGRTVLRIDPSGVKYDALALGRSDPDAAWDAVWNVATRIDSAGWTAELRIPFSELRLAASGPQTWGLQLWRYEQRVNETSQWAFWPKRDVGGPSAFGHLVGLAPSRPTIALQALPYVSLGVRPLVPAGIAAAAGASSVARARTMTDAGADLVFRTPGSAGTVTVNPDFGQVEVDPAILNLTALETFFPEKRPFFVQDAGVLSYGAVSCFVCDAARPLQLYYSRRIGQPASFTPAGRLVEEPGTTPIAAAARVTSQTRGGWTMGALVARTRSAYARIMDSTGNVTRVPLVPATWYVASRADRRATSGDGSLGLIATMVGRDVGTPTGDPLAARFPARAFTGGADADRWLARHTYHVTVDAALSSVRGDSGALERVQTSSVHYFQRPGRATTGGTFDDRLDASRRSLDGYAATARLAKDGGDWTWEAVGEAMSPGFEANDFGFVPVAGVQWLTANARRSLNTPTRWYHAAEATVGTELARNFDGDAILRANHAAVSVTLPTYATFALTARVLPARYDDRLLRGGPTVAVPAGDSVALQVASDVRGAVSESLRLWHSADGSGARDIGIAPGVALHPTDALSVSVALGAQRVTATSQYVTAVADSTRVAFAGHRYVVARLDEHTLSLELRGAAAITPTISFDAFLQPFTTSGAYGEFGEYSAPHTASRIFYGRDAGTITRPSSDESLIIVDPDGSGPAPPFEFHDPTGRLTSLRGTAVLRWEFRPGSSLVAAWTQTRASAVDLAAARPANAFIAKMTWRVAP